MPSGSLPPENGLQPGRADLGTDSMSLDPDSVVEIIARVAEVELR